MCQLLNKRTWTSCVREVASPELDCLLDFARISTRCAVKTGWPVCAGRWLRIVPARNPSLLPAPTPLCPLHQRHCGVGTAILREVGWLSPWGWCRVYPHQDSINLPKNLSLLFCLNSDTQWRHNTTEAYESSVVQNHNSENKLDHSF